jgi:glycosyltransferase involved in cell wall biosynthesis
MARRSVTVRLTRVKLAIISDFVEEGWPSMDLVADELVRSASELPGVSVGHVRPVMLGPFSKLAPQRSASYLVKNADRFSGRYLEYSLRMLRERGRFDRFHVVDHSYAHLALLLPAKRIGVFCHDTDAFMPLFQPHAPRWRKALASVLLAGMRRADVVFYSTASVRESIVRHALLPEQLLVHAPYGVAREFQPVPSEEDVRLDGRPPFVLHVGSLITRKNPEFLLRLVASLRDARPELELVQVGGTFSIGQERLVDELALRPHLRRLSGLTRGELAALYRRAQAVLLPSTAEGFGLPITEALSCGAPVIASDLPVLREVGGDAADYCPVNALESWKQTVLGVLDTPRDARTDVRLRTAASYSWHAHAKTIVAGHELASRSHAT